MAERPSLRERLQKVRAAVQSGGASIGVDLVVGTAERIADIADRFIKTGEEKDAFALEWQKAEMEEERLAMEADAAIMADRQSARAMAGAHGETQAKVAKIFIIAFFVVVLADLVFVGFLTYLALGNPTFMFPAWLTGLIGSTLASITTGMSLKVDQILGFLYGGSAGGDDREARLSESMRNNAPPTQ